MGRRLSVCVYSRGTDDANVDVSLQTPKCAGGAGPSQQQRTSSASACVVSQSFTKPGSSLMTHQPLYLP
ncbi:hypothetical protein OUZ56_002694 [Daphnia magna]|uniref:Uncharacterized protein n=1 Tax=Daphnia magna TaxID=35525 RepID=A0ABR0A6R2_9CRUS|nr:hypothetical protein OUZ56_002694 [Daphnia magna]